jgi:bacteriocin biosynthesis cyclodehydratase domain-containing protein
MKEVRSAANSQAGAPGRSDAVHVEGRLTAASRGNPARPAARAGAPAVAAPPEVTHAACAPEPDSSVLRLKRTVEAFPASDGCIYLLRNAAAETDLAIEHAGTLERDLIAALAEGVRGVEDLHDRLIRRGHEVRAALLGDALGALSDLGVLERTRPEQPSLAEDERERYDRQLAYFADIRPGQAEAIQRRLCDARVVVIGAGGLGSWTLCGLACAGIGHLVAVDDDTIELSNLNRQLLYRHRDLGRPKVEVAAEALAAFNPRLTVVPVRRRVHGAEDIAALARTADMVVLTADWPIYAIERWMNEACVDVGVPHISAGQYPPHVRVGPLYVPGRTGCFECFERASRREFGLYDELARWRQCNPTVAATLGPASGIIGEIIAMEVMHYLAGLGDPATLGASVTIDLRSLLVERRESPSDPECPTCGERVGAAAGGAARARQGRPWRPEPRGVDQRLQPPTLDLTADPGPPGAPAAGGVVGP